MKTISIQQGLFVSGGCQNSVNTYIKSAESFTFIGKVVGLIGGGILAQLTFSSNPYTMPLVLLGAVGGCYVGGEVGYVTGAIAYWVDRTTYKTVDYFLKPSL